MRLLIDLECILFRCLFATKDLSYHQQLRACDAVLDRILDKFNYPEYMIALSGSNNFRKKIDPEYKANRKTADRPQYLWDATRYYEKYWGAFSKEGLEADDLISMNYDEDCLIIGCDKDYMQLKMKMYNPWKDIIQESDNPEYYFYRQMLEGDSADNVKAIYGIGPRKAEKLLSGKSKDEMRTEVQYQYQQFFGENWYQKYDTNAQLLFLKRSLNSTYNEYF